MASITILGIESSCDETAASVVQDGRVLSNVIYTQEVHAQHGGVVPESASRLHMKHIVPVVEQAFRDSGLTINDVDAVAYTQAPGLIGSLLVGAGFAKGVAQVRGIPTLAVNHMQAHVFANFIEHPNIPYPFLCLTVSGGIPNWYWLKHLFKPKFWVKPSMMRLAKHSIKRLRCLACLIRVAL